MKKLCQAYVLSLGSQQQHPQRTSYAFSASNAAAGGSASTHFCFLLSQPILLVVEALEEAGTCMCDIVILTAAAARRPTLLHKHVVWEKACGVRVKLGQ